MFETTTYWFYNEGSERERSWFASKPGEDGNQQGGVMVGRSGCLTREVRLAVPGLSRLRAANDGNLRCDFSRLFTEVASPASLAVFPAG